VISQTEGSVVHISDPSKYGRVFRGVEIRCIAVAFGISFDDRMSESDDVDADHENASMKMV
jgi:hypothetical protein